MRVAHTRGLVIPRTRGDLPCRVVDHSLSRRRLPAALNANVKFTYVDDYDFLRAHKIEEAIPWAMLSGNNDGMMSIRNTRAIAAGLSFRPLADTVRDTLAWWPSVPEARRAKPRFSITPEIEAAALAAWHACGS